MAHDYSYREMKRMQEDAIRRVWEMQERATLPMEIKPEKAEQTAKSSEESKAKQDAKDKKVDNPRKSGLPKKSRHDLIKKNQNDLMTKIPDRINHILKDDELCEQILLIAIIILLMNEKADNILILAILYILAD